MLRFLAIGDWLESDVSVALAEDTRRRLPEVEARIERAWAEASARFGARLFDGPMCRLERLEATARSLSVWLSPTSYKPFLGTNLMNADVATETRANPVGLSALLLTRDRWVMLGKRNGGVAYYPNRIHSFAGSLEPTEAMNVFDGLRRELREELHFTDRDVTEMRCLGVVEDVTLGQPEIVFSVRSARTRVEVESMLDAAEHQACVAVEATLEQVDVAMRDALLTPVAVGALALWGRLAFGRAWFESWRDVG